MKNKMIKKLLASMLVVVMMSLLLLNSAFAWPSDKWNSLNNSGHKSLVLSLSASSFSKGSSNTTNNRDITANAAFSPDNKSYMDASANTYNSVTNYSPYHAKSEYTMNQVIAHAGFLYNLSKECLSGNSFDVAVGKCINIDTYSAGGYTGTIDSTTELRIISDLTNLMNDLSVTSAYDRGYVILGVYFHLLEDIYAHRAVLTSTMATTIPVADFKSSADRNNLLSDINLFGGIPMIRLKDYLVSTDTLTFTYNGTTYNGLSAAGKYEDNPFYWTARYTATQNATSAQLSNIMSNNSFTFSNYSISLYANKMDPRG